MHVKGKEVPNGTDPVTLQNIKSALCKKKTSLTLTKQPVLLFLSVDHKIL